MRRKRSFKRLAGIIAAGSIAAIGIGAVQQEEPRMEVIEYSVQPGDSIWSIAQEHRDDDQDVRELVYQITEDNDIKNSHISPGQILSIKKEAPDTPISDASEVNR